MFKAKVEYWDCLRKTKEYPSGGYYQDNTSEVIRTEEWTGETEDDILLKFYKENNSLRYCNGSYYVFVDAEWKDKYKLAFKRLHTIENYYGNGVVD